MDIQVKKVLDAKGLACPMPVVRAKKAIDELQSGEVLEVHTTDEGSKSDLTAWAKSGGHDMLQQTEDRKSTRLNSSHVSISYAVFCLTKTKINRALMTNPPRSVALIK